jgi:hypothetical protein
VADGDDDTWQIGDATRGRPYSADVARVAARRGRLPYRTRGVTRTRHVSHADLALLARWTNKKVTRVTTHRVTRGTLTSPSDVADTRQMTGGVRKRHVAAWQGDRWRTAGDVAAHVGQSGADTCHILIGEKRVPRGPLRGSHVAPHCWWFWCRRVR